MILAKDKGDIMERNPVEELYEKDKKQFYTLIGIMISSSSLTNQEDCKSAISTLEKVKMQINNSEKIDDKTKKEWLDLCEQGLSIANSDIERMSQKDYHSYC